MHSRAFLLLEREYKNISKNALWGIQTFPNPQNMFQWIANISGLKSTDWEDGIFRVRLTFNEHFDNEWPEIVFETIPFHPNIDAVTGKPCISFLEDKDESSAKSIAGILVQIQTLLSNPVLEKAVNIEAVNILTHSPHIYTEIVHKCVVESNRIALEKHSFTAFIPKPKYIEIVVDQGLLTANTKLPNKLKQVSFDEYHKNWLGLGTSFQENKLSNTDYDSHLKYGTEMYQRSMSLTPSVSRSIAMGTEQNLNRLKAKKMEKISAMKQLYLSKELQEKDIVTPVTSRTDIGNDWANEADQLVAWTTGLNENEIA